MNIKILFVLFISLIFYKSYANKIETINGYTYTYLTVSDANEKRTHIMKINKKPSGDFKIPEVIGGNKVTRIESNLFDGSSDLTSIVIPESVTEIKSNAFARCINLRSIRMPDSIKQIDAHAFSGCRSLRSVILPKSLTVLKEFVFYSCENLESVIFSENLVKIYDSAFSGCKSLRSIHIPESVVYIGNRAFLGCESLLSIKIPSKIAVIESHVFYGCTKIKSVKMPAALTIIKTRAFLECQDLLEVTIPGTVSEIEHAAFSRNTKLIFKDRPNGVVYFGTTVHGYNGICPQSIVIKNGTTAIMGNAFLECEDLCYIKIPKSVIEIEYGAFNNTQWHKKHPKGLLYVGSFLYGFKRDIDDFSSSLKKIPEDVKVRGDVTGIVHKYNEETKENHFTFSSWIDSGSGKVIYIGRIAYGYEGKCLSKVILRSNVVTIGRKLFCNTKISSIIIPDSVTSIEEEVFFGCQELKSIRLPPKLKIIENSVFCASGLENIIIPNGVTTIKKNAFHNCKNLKKIIIGSGVKNIEEKAFSFCENVEEIYWRGDYPENIANNIFSGVKVAKLKHYVSPNAKGWDKTFLGSDVIIRK